MKEEQYEIVPLFTNFMVTGIFDIHHEKVTNWLEKQIHDKTGKVQLSFNEPELQELYTNIQSGFNKVHNTMRLRPDWEQEIHVGWANKEYTNRTSVTHIHALSTLICVYYPFVNGEVGSLRLQNPCAELAYVIPSHPSYSACGELNQYNTTEWEIRPRTGLFVIFPSWIPHNVISSEKENTRYSIAINSKLKKK